MSLATKCAHLLARVCLLIPAFSFTAQSQSATSNYDVIRESVVFLYIKDAQGKEAPDGTGFLLSVPSKTQPNRGYVLLVTARHIADPAWIGCASKGELVAKLNKKIFDPQKDEKGTTDYALGGQQWIFVDDDSIDMAYTFLDGVRFQNLNVENLGISLTSLPSASESKSVHVGDQVVSAGLLAAQIQGSQDFSDALSSRRNYPIFKFGNVSSIPEEKITVGGCGGKTRLMTEWLIAANLVPGNSGSPIVYMPPILPGGRPFVLGVQSVSFSGFDVAGMAPIAPILVSLKHLNLADADLSKPDNALTTQAMPTGIPSRYPAKVGPLPTPKL